MDSPLPFSEGDSKVDQLIDKVFLFYNQETLPEPLKAGLYELVRYAPHKNIGPIELDKFSNKPPYPQAFSDLNRLTRPEFIWELTFIDDTELNVGQLEVKYLSNHNDLFDGSNLNISIHYRRPTEAFKAVGRLLANAFQLRSFQQYEINQTILEDILNFTETAQFETFCWMIDCSRNAVPNLPTLCEMLRFSALMGYNMMQLYTEDTYQIKDEPYFGFCRGGYSQHQLKFIDDYAFDLGIEVVACIQTLGHLGQILQWPRYHEVRDTTEILLCKSDDTYELIEKMIDAATTPLRSKRIHIGMDESYGLGEGRFKQQFGKQDDTQIFVDHLQRVRELCEKRGLRPMIWSDMLFCLSSKNMSLSGYYSDIEPISLNASNTTTTSDLDLIHWDYYHTDAQNYTVKLSQLKRLGCKEPWMAGGAWTWSRFWAAMQYSIRTIQASMTASKQPDRGANHYMVTIWGDEGSECDYYSALPILAYSSILAYSPNTLVDVQFLGLYFAGICGGELNAWYDASQIDELPMSPDFLELENVQHSSNLPSSFPPNVSKHLLWEDPFYSIMSPGYDYFDLEGHYSQLHTKIQSSIHPTQLKLYPLNTRLQLPLYISKVLSLKVKLRPLLQALYQRGHRDELQYFATRRIKELKDSLVKLWHYHRSLWHYSNGPFGWEVLELRYAGVVARLDTMVSRITDYCDYHNKKRLWADPLLSDDPLLREDLLKRDDKLTAKSDVDAMDIDSLPNSTPDPPNHTRSNTPKLDDITIPFNANQANAPANQQFSIWPQHATHPNLSLNPNLESLPELELIVDPPFQFTSQPTILEYYRISTTSRPG